MYPRNSSRLAFDGVASTYDQIRPDYPAKVIDDLITVTELGNESKILEIGPGTGQLTLQLARKGFDILALEIGKNLFEICRRNLSPFPSVRIENGDFDHYELPSTSVDLVVAATSYHWLDPASRITRIASLLRDRGTMAIIDTVHVNGGSRQFFRDTQDCYMKWDPNTKEKYELPEASEVETSKWESETSDLFTTLFQGRYFYNRHYSASDYISLMKTYSDVASLGEDNRKGILNCIGTLIDSRYQGKITKRYLIELFVARIKS